MKKILFIAMLALLVLGCGSRKRAMQKSEKELSFVAEKDTSTDMYLKNDIVEKTDSNESVASESKEQDFDIGPGGKMTVREFDDQGNVKKETTIENNGRSKQKHSRTSSDKKIASEKKDRSVTDNHAEGKSKIVAKSVEKNKAVAVDRKSGGYFWMWFLLLLLVIGVLYAWYRFRK